MRNILSISVNDDMKNKLDRIMVKENTSRSEIIKRALEQYFYTVEMVNLRNELRPYAEKQGIFSEEDVFNTIS